MTAHSDDTRFFGHPRGLATLFMTELWERFSYYGMRAILILFMTAPVAGGGLGFEVAKAGAIYGFYTSMVYLVSLPGGWVADRFLGQRRAVLYGGIVMALGNFSLMAQNIAFFYTGLGLIVIGTGLLKPNISVLVGQLYTPDDARRDAGFSIYYMGINIGAFLAPFACGWVGERIDWRLGMGLAGVGMTVGVIQYLLGGKHLGQAGLRPGGPAGPELKRRVLTGLAIAAVCLTFLALTVGLTAQMLSNALGFLLFATVAGFFAWMFFFADFTPVERKRMFAVGVLFLASCFFWSVFEQAGSTLNLFAQRNTNTEVLGFAFPASWFQSVNALFIIALAPVFAWLWVRLGAREPSSPAKFALGLLGAGGGFLLLVAGAQLAETGVRVSPLWLVGVYLLHTIGELCLSPVGLSAMTKLAPERITGLLMGVWFLSISVGNYLGGRMAALYETLTLSTLLGVVGGFGVAAALLLACFVKPIKGLMGGVK
ncbi:MAG: peptide MFS transporter [Bryobacterales bacterium]|nr:peptide MFS transporter [Bryobacterales bacterium]